MQYISDLDNFRIVGFLFFGRTPGDSSHISLYFVRSLSQKYFILKVLMCIFQDKRRNCIVDKSLKIIKLIKNAVRLILDNFGIVGFLVSGRMPVDSSHRCLLILIVFWAQSILFWRL
jgi:hypothetical protein